MRVLSVASELYPLIKTGGLADVAGALPGALKPLGVAMRTLVPGYPAVLAGLTATDGSVSLEDALGGAVRLILGHAGELELIVLDAPHLFARPGTPYLGPDGRDWPDNFRRYGMLARVAADVRKLAAGQAVLEEQVAGSVKKLRGDTQQSLQMAALLPMLFKPKSKTLAELAAAGEATTAKFMIDSNDSLSTMLPLLLMGGMGGGTAGGTGGDNNMVMMFALMMAMDRK